MCMERGVCAVADVSWEAEAAAAPAAAGGVAAVTCGAEPARAALWYRDDRLLHLDPPTPGKHSDLCKVPGSSVMIKINRKFIKIL